MRRLAVARRAVRGFTLVETLLVMVVLGIAAVTIISLQGNLFSGQAQNKNIVVGTQLMQECAELLLAKSRINYNDSCLASGAAATTCCATITVTGYGAPTVPTLSAGNSTSANMAACPFGTGSDCKLVSVTQGGLSPITLMLISH